jgi:hypothetical protein
MSGTEAAAAIAEVNQQAAGGGAKPIRPSKDLFQVEETTSQRPIKGLVSMPSSFELLLCFAANC